MARAPADLQSVHGVSNLLGPYTCNLPRDAGTIRLEHRNGGVLLELEYSDQVPWPAAATAAGHSLVLSQPSLGERDPWPRSASARIGGSPGASEPPAEDPLRALRINELLAKGSPGTPGFVELLNHGPRAIDVSDCILPDDSSLNQCVLPAGMTMAPGGFLASTEDQLGFGLSRSGETLWVSNLDRTAVLEAVRFGPQTNDVSKGSWPDGGGGSFSFFTVPTPGAANGDTHRPLRITSIRPAGQEEMVLTWPAMPGMGVRLQRATSLSDGDWRDVPDSEGVTTLRVSPTNGAAFFRLVTP